MAGNILILGRGGQLGSAFAELLGSRAIAVGREQADLARAGFTARLDAIVADRPLAAVINASAYTQVDAAEGAGRDEAFRVNAEAAGELALWAKSRELPLAHFSTDYVFDGAGAEPRGEDAPAHPINAYGESKLAGERAVASVGGQHLIIRSSWIYDAHGKNFFNTMLRLFAEKESIAVVADQVGAPTYAPHLANGAWRVLEAAMDMQPFPSGLYHLTAVGETSWHGFAQAIFTLARNRVSGIRCQRIDPIPSTAYPTPARRPLNSRLDCSWAWEIFGVTLPDWQEGLRECVEKKYGRSKLQHSGT